MLNSEEILERIRKILPNKDQFYPLHEPSFDEIDKNNVRDCVNSGWVSTAGSYVNKIEKVASTYLKMKHCIAVSSGTSGLHLSFIASGIRRDTEVICPSITFVATANSITYANATPHFVDVNKNSMCLDHNILDKYLKGIGKVTKNGLFNRKTGKRISAIVAVNVFGNSPDIIALRSLGDNYNIPIIEDAACAYGAKYNGKPIGHYSNVSSYSFNGNKVITSGGGGLVATNNDELAQKIRHLSTTAKVNHKWEYNHDEVGYNYRLPNLNAALLLGQIERIDQIVQNKRKLHKIYQNIFKNTDITIVPEYENCFSNFWLICLNLNRNSTKQRDLILKVLNDNNIMARPLWKPMHKLKMFISCPRSKMENANYLYDNIINIPSSPQLLKIYND